MDVTNPSERDQWSRGTEKPWMVAKSLHWLCLGFPKRLLFGYFMGYFTAAFLLNRFLNIFLWRIHRKIYWKHQNSSSPSGIIACDELCVTGRESRGTTAWPSPKSSYQANLRSECGVCQPDHQNQTPNYIQLGQTRVKWRLFAFIYE